MNITRRESSLSAIGYRLSAAPAAARRRGVGLAELLIALSISAALLTAIAVALDASFKAYRINQEQSTLVQRARLAVHRMLTSIRQSDAHAPVTTSLLANFSVGQVITDTGIQMYDDAGNLVSYRYDAPSSRLIMRSAGTDYTLLNGVTHFAVTIEPIRSATSIRTGGPYDMLGRATILLSLQTTSNTAIGNETTSNQTVTFSSSVMPRRNVW